MRLGIGGTYIAHHMVSDTMTKAVDGFINFEARSIIKLGLLGATIKVVSNKLNVVGNAMPIGNVNRETQNGWDGSLDFRMKIGGNIVTMQSPLFLNTSFNINAYDSNLFGKNRDTHGLKEHILKLASSYTDV